MAKFITTSGLARFYTRISSLIKSTTKVIDIAPNQWQSGIYTHYDSLITTTSNQEILPPVASSLNKEMRDMIINAQLVDAGQGNGWLKLQCEGTVPTSNIQLRIIFRGEK